MVVLRSQTVRQVNANEIAYEYSSWCNQHSDCIYKSKNRKYHGWINLENLTYEDRVAQCGWDDGDCSHTTHYGYGGYHNICPIAGINGDYVWPATLRFYDFGFKKHNITETATIKSIRVHVEHRMVAIDTGTGITYDNFGPNFNGEGWVAKAYFSKGDTKISDVKIFNSNPKLSKHNYSSFDLHFGSINIKDVLANDFALNIEYNHNHNTNPGIIYIKNIYIDIDYQDAKMYIDGIAHASSLYTNAEEVCRTKVLHTIYAGYENANGHINPNLAPKKLANQIECVKVEPGVRVSIKETGDVYRRFEIYDISEIEGKKSVVYRVKEFPNKHFILNYEAILRKKPEYNIIREYKSNEDFDPNKAYIVLKNGCASSISVYIDSLDSTPINLPVSNQNSSVNLLNEDAIRTFHNKIKTLSCGYHTLYIRRGTEPFSKTANNKVVIKINPMQFKFKIYTNETSDKKLKFIQSKTSPNSTIIIERIDDEPQQSIPSLSIFDETRPGTITTKNNVKKGDLISYQINKYYAGEFYINLKDNSPCSQATEREKIIIEGTHKQNFDYLFTRAENGTGFDFDYLVAWEGDNIKEPLVIQNIELYDSSNMLRICSDSTKSNLSAIGLVPLHIKNTSSDEIQGIEIELNVLTRDDNNKLEVTTGEWTNPDGIFNQFYNLFYEYNIENQNNIEILNLTPDGDLVDEENVYLFIHKIDPNDTIKIELPFRSVSEKQVFLQYLLFEEPLKINSIDQCNSDSTPSSDMIEINVQDLMLTDLEIIGNTDLLTLDKTYLCPDECYSTKENTADPKSGGITYRITNVDTNDFDTQVLQTQILNSNELTPYGYYSNGKYYPLLDNNGNKINVEEKEPVLDGDGEPLYEPLTDNQGNIILDANGNIQYNKNKPLYKENKLQWILGKEIINKIMVNQNVYCEVKFPNDDHYTEYAVKTNSKGIAEFFIPIPKSLNRTYTIEELLEEVLYFEVREQKDYNHSILTKQTNIPHSMLDENKNNVIIKYKSNFKRYRPNDVAHIVLTVSADIKIMKNYFNFYAELGDNGGSDEVTILYKICNIENNEGIFYTTFKTQDQKLVNNQLTRNIYCGLDTEVKIKTKIEKDITELTNLNVLYIDVYNQKKENQDVQIKINLGRNLSGYLGKYEFLDINIEDGDYSIIDDNNNIHVNWMIGRMDPFEKKNGIIKIKAQDIGLSNIKIDVQDYLHNPDAPIINIKGEECTKCSERPQWTFADSPWKKFNGIWYKKFADGTYKRPGKFKMKNGQYVREWIDKQ